MSTATRPFGVILVAVLILLAGLFNLVFGVWLVLAPATLALTDHTGSALANVPTFYLFMNGVLSIVMGFIYFWLLRMTMVGSATAHLIISMFAIINIVFALFRLPYGWTMIVVNVLVLLLVNTAKAKAWFSQTA